MEKEIKIIEEELKEIKKFEISELEDVQVFLNLAAAI